MIYLNRILWAAAGALFIGIVMSVWTHDRANIIAFSLSMGLCVFLAFVTEEKCE
jgi:hypothetical protein